MSLEETYKEYIGVIDGSLDEIKNQGTAAGEQGFERSKNPYPPHSAQYDSWDLGWTDSWIDYV